MESLLLPPDLGDYLCPPCCPAGAGSVQGLAGSGRGHVQPLLPRCATRVRLPAAAPPAPGAWLGPEGGAVSEEPGVPTPPAPQLPALFISDSSPHFCVLVISPFVPGDLLCQNNTWAREGHPKAFVLTDSQHFVLSPLPLRSWWVTHLHGLTPPSFVLNGNHTKRQEPPGIGHAGGHLHILMAQDRSGRRKPGGTQREGLVAKAAAGRCDSWSAGGSREACAIKAHPGGSVNTTLCFLPPSGSLLALGAKSDRIRS